MDADIHNLRDALEWLDRNIREEVELDGEMTNKHAIQLGFIQNMLAKFPLRNCDRYSHDEALQVWASEKSNERNGCFDEWLYEIAKKGDEK